MRDSIKYSLVGLAGAGIFAGAFFSNVHKYHEYRTVKNEMLHEIQVAEDRANDLDHKVDDCIKKANDCRSIYVQYKTASDEVGILNNKQALFEVVYQTSPHWEPVLGPIGAAIAGLGLSVVIRSYLQEKDRKKRESKVNENL